MTGKEIIEKLVVTSPELAQVQAELEELYQLRIEHEQLVFNLQRLGTALEKRAQVLETQTYEDPLVQKTHVNFTQMVESISVFIMMVTESPGKKIRSAETVYGDLMTRLKDPK